MVKTFRYIFPCEGKSLETKKDVGFALGVNIAELKGKDVDYGKNHDCKTCELNCQKDCVVEVFDNETRKIKKKYFKSCIAYSPEFLDTKEKEILKFHDTEDMGKYTIEVVLRKEDFSAVYYIKGKNKNMNILSLVETGLPEVVKKYKIKEDYENYYSLWMTNLETGETTTIDFDNVDEIIDSIVSMRFVEND